MITTNSHNLSELKYELAASERNVLMSTELEQLRTLVDHLEASSRENLAQADQDLVAATRLNLVLQRKNSALTRSMEYAAGSAKSETEKGLVSENYGRRRDTRNVSGPRVLRIAGIMDEFTASAFAKACTLMQPGVDNWREEIEGFKPDFVLVESAWQGNSGSWKGKIDRVSPELLALTAWCRENAIPCVLWNKEDPVHFNSFISSASLFDFVFTTDIGSIERYKRMLQHDRVFLLPFFCEPGLHNPIVSTKRNPGFSFAGAYYRRYPDRQKDFDSVLSGLRDLGPLTIYDRNYGKDLPEFEFPDQYSDSIVGSLPYDRISESYKGYEFGINMNSVKLSQSMFARRVFDLILSDTHVVSNYSRGLRLLFGDMVISSDDSVEITRRASELMDSEGSARTNPFAAYIRYRALRKVLREHSTNSRIDYICSKLWSDTSIRKTEAVTVIAAVSDARELERILDTFDAQTWQNKNLAVVLRRPFQLDVGQRRRNVRFIAASEAPDVVGRISDSTYCSIWNVACNYGSEFLYDSIEAFRFGDFSGVFMQPTMDDGLGLKDCYSEFTVAPYYSSVLRTEDIYDLPTEFNSGSWQDAVVCGGVFLSIPSFEFSSAGTQLFDTSAWELKLKHGVSMDVLNASAEAIPVGPSEVEFDNGWSHQHLAANFETASVPKGVGLLESEAGVRVDSSLQPDEHAYVYSLPHVKISDLWNLSDTSPMIHCVCSPGLMTSVVVLYFNELGQRIGSQVFHANHNYALSIPDSATSIMLGIRVQGSGTTVVSAIAFEELDVPPDPTPKLDSAKHLILTNVYPSPSALYRNGFVHSRARSYAEAGLTPSVFTLNPRAQPHTYEFEGIDVQVGGVDVLESLLVSNEYDSILVHFLDEAMWGVLRKHYAFTPIIVWIHGAEIQPWYRRDFNFADDSSRDVAKISSEARIRFWKSLLPIDHPNLHFVFVSDYFAKEVMEDVDVVMKAHQFSIIHNFVDTNIFAYQQKREEKRFRLLSIRPFASRKYANDLTVAAIVELAEHPRFIDCEILIIGDGPLFDETLAPLAGMSNVTVQRKFLSQREISKLHADYGIFLTPTRMDSQGVSRDEAMSSGLVPVTNSVTAIPEFVDDGCAILVPGEDSSAMAKGVGILWDQPNRFAMMSKAAASRVRNQSDFTRTIGREIKLINAYSPRRLIACELHD